MTMRLLNHISNEFPSNYEMMDISVIQVPICSFLFGRFYE